MVRIVAIFAWTRNRGCGCAGNASKEKNVWFQWECFCGDNTHAFLHLFSSNGYGANVSEAVGKIATDEKDYHKYSLCVIVC